MSILVTGGTGTVGAALVKELAGRGSQVRVLTRNPSKVKPAKGITAVQGDLIEPSTVRRVFDGIDAVFLLNAVGRTEACGALMAITGMRPASVKPVGYLSVHHAAKPASRPPFGSQH